MRCDVSFSVEMDRDVKNPESQIRQDIARMINGCMPATNLQIKTNVKEVVVTQPMRPKVVPEKKAAGSKK